MGLSFEPRRPQHAIAEFTASLRYRSPSDQKKVPSISGAVAQLAAKLDLPAPMAIQMLQLGMMQPAQFMPFGFQRYAKDGSAAASLLCDPESITFTTSEYTGWSEVKPVLVNALTVLSKEYLRDGNAISSVRLQYLNEFRSLEFGPVPACELFNPDGGWINPRALHTGETWHSYTGQFLPVSDTQKTLINVNCDVLDSQFNPGEPQRRYVKVLILTGHFFDGEAISRTVFETDGELERHIDELVEGCHHIERRVLAEVLSEQYLDVVGALNAPF